VVWRSTPITHGPFAVLKTLSEEEKDKIAALLVALEATRPKAYDRLNPFYGGGYAPVDPEDYRGLETLTAQDIDALSLPIVVSERSERLAPTEEQ
jgi:ABC-type phosphate/phosphonate transport system substrate-binding protein